MSGRWIVVTTIQRPTAAMRSLGTLREKGWDVVAVGDTTTPPDWECPGVEFLGVERQRQIFPGLADLLPFRHYCRKNLGYLYAIEQGADCILETDDDNIPLPSFGSDLERRVRGTRLRGPGWVNPYPRFTSFFPIWPRGLPLDAIHEAGQLREEGVFDCPVQQFLAEGDWDVDAIFRFLFKGEVSADRGSGTVVLDLDAWCPFNSQNTLFFRDAFPLLYLPGYVSFRMTDIWRSFVALVALHKHGYRIAFRPATVRQERNPHDLMSDFQQEIPGYLENRGLMSVLEETAATARADSLAETARALWMALGEARILTPQEMPVVNAWLDRFVTVP